VREVVPAAEPAIVDSAAVDSAQPSATVDSSAPTPSVSVNTSNAHAAAAHTLVSAPAPASGIVASAKPRYRSNPAPDYPVPSRRRQEEGIVLLNVLVRPDGLAAAVSLNRSSGYPLLDRAALDAVNRWTFEPARAAGVPVSSTILIPIRFSLSDAH
jgi:protein TonB